MTIKDNILDGVKIINNSVWYDYRGCFHTPYNHEEFSSMVGEYNFVQDNESVSHKGVLRGFHYQVGEYEQAKLVRVIRGSVIDVIVDIRPNSKTFTQHFSIKLSGDDQQQLLIPRGFAHGFLSLEDDTIFSYKVDNKYHPSSERGIIFDDPTINFDWGQYGVGGLIISEKDLRLPKLKDVIF